MDSVSRDQLEALCRQRRRFCISVFMPTHRAGAETRQDPIRLKNLLRNVETQLVAHGARKTEAREILGPARQLAQRGSFWRTQSDGLVIYLAGGFFQYFRLPLELPERVAIGESFEIKPLVPLFTAGGRFYALALSRKRIRLFEGTRFGISEVELHTVPHSIEDALKYDVRETQQQVHTGTGAPGVRGKEGAVFHGQSIGLDDAHKRVLEYFRQVNRGVRGLLKGPWAPLVLAGVEELVPIYKQANTYPNLVEQSIEGNPDRMNASELHKAAQDALRLYFEEARKQAVEHYRAAIGTAKASNALPELLIGAYHGRLEFALIPPCAERWGRFDPEQDTVEIHDAPQTGDEDLVNAVAIHTILNHGAVYAVAPQDIPGAAPVAAVFRYPVGTITDTAEVYAGEEVQP